MNSRNVHRSTEPHPARPRHGRSAARRIDGPAVDRVESDRSIRRAEVNFVARRTSDRDIGPQNGPPVAGWAPYRPRRCHGFSMNTRQGRTVRPATTAHERDTWEIFLIVELLRFAADGRLVSNRAIIAGRTRSSRRAQTSNRSHGSSRYDGQNGRKKRSPSCADNWKHWRSPTWQRVEQTSAAVAGAIN